MIQIENESKVESMQPFEVENVIHPSSPQSPVTERVVHHSGTQNNSIADELMKLKELLDQGVISKEELNELKRKILGGSQ